MGLFFGAETKNKDEANAIVLVYVGIKVHPLGKVQPKLQAPLENIQVQEFTILTLKTT